MLSDSDAKKLIRSIVKKLSVNMLRRDMDAAYKLVKRILDSVR